jgi:hypothetical protein
MLLSLFPSLSEKECAAIWCCCAALWIIWVLSDLFGRKAKGTSTALGNALQVPKVAFAREVIRWCMQHLGLPKGSKTGPRLLLRYYRHRKVMGTYQQRSKTITLYWGSHVELKEVVNTLIHEYQHFLDIRSGKDDRAYDKEIKEVGYQDNSYEKRAREVANRCQRVCLRELEKRGLVG